MKILVTGGAGFIGSHTVALLVSSGHEVVVLDDLFTGKIENLTEALGCQATEIDTYGSNSIVTHVGPIKFIHTRTDDMNATEMAIKQCDAVLNLGALVSVQQSFSRPGESFKRNMQGFFNVLESAQQHGKQRVVYASSAAVYGDKNAFLFEPMQPLTPMSPYGCDKLANELYAQMMSRCFGLQTIGLRYFNVYGPRQDPSSPYSGVIAKFVDRALKGEDLLIYGDGNQTRNFINVKDVARVNVAAVTNQEGFEQLNPTSIIMNVGCVNSSFKSMGVETTIYDLAWMIIEKCNSTSKVVFADAQTGDIRKSVPDLTTLSTFVPSITSSMVQLEHGIEELIEYQARKL